MSIRYFKTSAEESFGAFIGNLTNERNTRTALATEIYSRADRDLKHATDMNDRARADREQSIDEYLRDAEILSRHYESIARDGVVSLSAECKVLAGVVAELIATRKTSYDEIVRTMGSVLDGLQNTRRRSRRSSAPRTTRRRGSSSSELQLAPCTHDQASQRNASMRTRRSGRRGIDTGLLPGC